MTRQRIQASLAALAAAALAAGSLAAQEETQETALPAVFRDATEVSVTNVDVIVTDRSGRPVTGLGKEDFELLSDGVPIEISNFYAVEGGRVLPSTAVAEGAPGEAEKVPPQAGQRRLHLAIFVDNPNITANHRARIFSRLRKFLLANRRDDVHVTLAAPAVTAAGLEIVASSDVPHEIFAALDELEEQSVAVNRLELERRQIVRALEAIPIEGGFSYGGIKGSGLDPVEEDDSDEAMDTAQRLYAFAAETLLPQIRSYSQQRFEMVRRSLASLERMVDLLAGLPGRKALVYVSDGLPMRSGEALFESYAHRVQAIRSVTSGFATVSSESEVARYDASQHFSSLMGRSNAARVSFYTLDAAPSAAVQRGSAEAGTAFHLSGFEAVDEGNRESSLAFMAEQTGGRAALGNAALEAALEGIFDDFDNHYSLGFTAAAEAVERPDRRPPDRRPPDRRPPDGRPPKSLKVRVRGEGLTVRHRRAWMPRTHEQRMAEHTLAALLNEEHKNPLDVALAAGEPAAGGSPPGDKGTVVVPFLVEVPLGRLVLLPEKSEHHARVSLYVAARDERGRMSEVARHLCPIKIPNSEMLVALGRSMVCGVRLTLRTGRQTVAVAVHDELADIVATTSLKVDVQEPPAAAPKREADPEPGSGSRR